MMTFKTNERAEIAFKNVVLCKDDKNEGKIISAGISDIFKNIEYLDDKIKYISQSISEKGENVISTAMILYPDLNLNEAVNRFYEDIKKVNERFNLIDNKKTFTKYIRINKETKKTVDNFSLSKGFISKAVYLKKITEFINNCPIIN